TNSAPDSDRWPRRPRNPPPPEQTRRGRTCCTYVPPRRRRRSRGWGEGAQSAAPPDLNSLQTGVPRYRYLHGETADFLAFRIRERPNPPSGDKSGLDSAVRLPSPSTQLGTEHDLPLGSPEPATR